MSMQQSADWTKPGPGTWELDSSHSPAAPTRLLRRMFPISIWDGYEKVFSTYGGPLKTLEVAFVHGKFYRRTVPLVGGDRDAKAPPPVVLWLATRLHPAFRRANKLAARTQEEKRFLDVLDQWEQSERQSWIDRNRALQSVDMAALDDGALAAHLERLDDHLLTGLTRHHELHGSDLGPIGDLLVHAKRWGLDQAEVMRALSGRSPATVEAARMLSEVAAAVAAAGVGAEQVTSLDAVRAASPDAAAALDRYLDLYGARIVTSYDIEGLTAAELPDTMVAIIRTGVATGDEPGSADDTTELVASLRAEVPDDARADFDELLDSAQRAYGLRDDNGPLTGEWPIGMMRLAFLEASGRLHAAGRLSTPSDVFELDTPEIASLLRGATGPDQAEIERRKEERAWERTLSPPSRLGPPEEMPPSWVLPGPMRRMSEIVVEAIALLEPDRSTEREQLTGLGIGDETYRGRARVAHSAEEVLGTLEPGDVLVAAWTAPTYNAVLAIAGGVIVQEGGLLCHAAVLARELGIPAVIGAADAMSVIADGDMVEIDPVAGRVTVLS